MKNLVRLCAFATLLCSFVSAHAQWAEPTGGGMIICVTDQLAALLQPKGVTMAVYTPAPFDIQIPFLGINTGAVNPANGTGFISLGGQIDITNGNTLVRINALQLETSMQGAVVTGNMSINNHYIVRLIVLVDTVTNPLQAPFSLGQLKVGGIPATLSDGVLKTIAAQFGITVPPPTPAVIMEINASMVGVTQQ